MSAITDPQITVSHRIPLALARWIELRAIALGVSKSEVIRLALADAVAKHDATTEGEAA